MVQSAPAGNRAERMDDTSGASAERSQLARLEALDDLLPTLAGVLDIREVFERVSSIVSRTSRKSAAA